MVSRADRKIQREAMIHRDHIYLVEKLNRQEEMLTVYGKCFNDMMEWFVLNDKHLKKLPVSKRPRIPGE